MGVFDGLAGVLNSVFGAPVLLLPARGGEQTLQAVFRQDPVEVLQDDGRSVLIAAPTLRVPEPGANAIARGDQVRVGGVTYFVLNRMASASPASDRFVMFELQEHMP